MRKLLVLWVVGGVWLACSGEPSQLVDGGSGGGSALGGGSGGGTAGGAGGGNAGGGAGGGGGTALDDGGSDGGVDSGVADAGVSGVPFAFVGSGDNRIRVYRVNRTSGALTLQGTFDGGSNPSFLALSPDQRFVYAVNESSSTLASFALNRTTGALSFINRIGSQGNGPAHIFVDPSGKWVMAANYGGGTAAVFPARDGGMGAATDVESPGPKAHQIVTDPSNRYAFVPTLGSDIVAQYLFDVDAGTLTANGTLATATGAGPRHIAFHPSLPNAYVINESNSTLLALAFDTGSGRLTLIDTYPTLPTGFTGTNTTAEVAVHPNGKFVYGSNRGHDSIVVFRINPADGRLTLVEHEPTGGQRPRHFSIDPAGGLLYAANQQSGNIFAFRVDQDAGALTSLGQVAAPPSPAFVGIFELVDQAAVRR